MSQTFTVVNNAVLESSIREARKKIVYVAPGVSTVVAKALGNRFKDLGNLSITLILDVDPEVYRLGYGDPEGLDIIKRLADEHLLELRQQAGVRIGLLIADDRTLIYSPTPLLIEAGSTQPEKPNAIVLQGTPEVIDRACASGAESLPSEAEIGTRVIKQDQLEKIKKDLEELPPKHFDVARIERVFNSRIQYVEFKLTKYRLSKKTAPIPPDLMGLEEDPTIQDRWKNAFRMFDGANKIKVEIPLRDESGGQRMGGDGEPRTIIYGEEALEADRRKIEKDFFYKVHGYGVVIFRSRRTAFDRRVDEFRQRIQDYQEAVQQKISASIDDTIKRLTNVLLPLIREKTPDRYLKAALTTELQGSVLARMLEDDLRSEFGTPEELASPEIKLQYKDISYETIHDDGFKEALERSGIPKSSLTQLFSEHDAAPETIGEPH